MNVFLETICLIDNGMSFHIWTPLFLIELRPLSGCSSMGGGMLIHWGLPRAGLYPILVAKEMIQSIETNDNTMNNCMLVIT